MNIIPYIFYPLTIGAVIFTIAFFKYPRYAIAALIIAKPIIDVTWDYHILLDINFLKLYAGLFVILGAIYIIFHRPKILRHQLSIVWLIFLGLNLVSIFIISDAHLLLGKISYFLRILTGFVALILFAHLFDFEKDKKFVLCIFIVAGIFPILLWLIPVLIGNPIISNDPLQRIMGPYQNFWNFSFYAIQTLIFCLVYLSLKNPSVSRLPNFPPSKLHSIIKSPFLRFSVSSRWSRTFKLVKRVVLYLMILISIAMIYKCYSKAGWITLVLCFFGWFLLRRKFILAGLIPVITAIIVFVNPFAADLKKTFINEIAYVTKGPDLKESVFRGRLSRWGIGMKVFKSLPVVNKLFGANKSIGNPENDYLRVLWQNGIFGFLSYISLLCLTGYFLISRYAGTKEVVMLMGILVFMVFLINGIGSYAMYYPNLQWFMWGTVGFIISNPSGFHFHRTAVNSNALH
jgi:O-antigen ligase